MTKSRIVTICAAFALIASAHAQRQLQDNYWISNTWTSGFNLGTSSSLFGMAVGQSNRVYIAYGSGIAAYSLTGTAITNIAIPNARDVFYEPKSNFLYTCSAQSSNQVRIYDGTTHALLKQWGTNSLSTPVAVAVGPDGLVYIADTGNHRVQVFDIDGNFVRRWGKLGSAGGDFSGVYDVSVGANNRVYVADYNNRRLQMFTLNGDYVTHYFDPTWSIKVVGCSVDGTVFAGMYGGLASSRTFTYDLQSSWISHAAAPIVHGGCFSPDGRYFLVLRETDVLVHTRTYRTLGPTNPAAIPFPTVVSAAQRPGTTLIDVDYFITDADSPTVEVGAIAFHGGRKDLRAAVPIITLDEGTSTNLATNIVVGATHHLTWNAGTDWVTNYANVKINILANDGRGLVDFHYLDLPAIDSYTNVLRISQSPIQNDDFLGVWTWLLSRNDPDIMLTTGQVYGVSGVYSNVLLASTPPGISTLTTTTPQGRQFIFERMNVREATSNEVVRAAVATTPSVVTRWDARTRVGALPAKLNEFGFDTGLLLSNNVNYVPTNVWWVVPLP